MCLEVGRRGHGPLLWSPETPLSGVVGVRPVYRASAGRYRGGHRDPSVHALLPPARPAPSGSKVPRENKLINYFPFSTGKRA